MVILEQIIFGINNMKKENKKRMSKEEFFKNIEKTFETCLDISKKKNNDYSKGESPFKNFELSEFMGVKPARGILVRITDKLSRISNLLEGEYKVKDERIEDTINDAINYLAILKAYLSDK